MAVVINFMKLKKMASINQGRSYNLCCSQIHSTSQNTSAALDALITDALLGVSRMQLLLSGQVCGKCYQNLEKLDETRATVSQLIATMTSLPFTNSHGASSCSLFTVG